MARYRGTVHSSRPAAEALGFVADFSNLERWDPSVVRARRLDTGDLAVGSRFAVTTRFIGREIELEYELVELDGARFARLRAETPTAISIDTIEARGTFGACEITYEADLQLKGVFRLAELPTRLAFRRLGEAARAGLQRALA